MEEEKLVAIYTRVSTTDQAREGHSLEDENEPLGQQKTYLQKYLQNKGFTDFGKSFF